MHKTNLEYSYEQEWWQKFENFTTMIARPRFYPHHQQWKSGKRGQRAEWKHLRHTVLNTKIWMARSPYKPLFLYDVPNVDGMLHFWSMHSKIWTFCGNFFFAYSVFSFCPQEQPVWSYCFWDLKPIIFHNWLFNDTNVCVSVAIISHYNILMARYYH